jgi:acetylornithine deacetylase
MERRTVSGETGDDVLKDVHRILAELSRADPEFHATASLGTYRPAYSLDREHALSQTMTRAIARSGRTGVPTGMTFWTDAAILGDAGIPSVLFGPGGAGLHSVEEYVTVDDVLACRDILVAAVRDIVG